jgi:hypothetical protein
MKNQLIKLSDGRFQSDVFYGSFQTRCKGKSVSVSVSNHIRDLSKKYEFRVAYKCRAGFISIQDYNVTPSECIRTWGKNNLVNVQVKNEFGHWMDAYTVKSGRWYSIDKTFLDILTVGDMRTSFPDMCDHNIWDVMGAKTWADKAFTPNVMAA